MIIIQIVGYKNSGKTTLITEWIPLLKGLGYRIATLKHHGHGGEPDVIAEVDSIQHFRAGATMSAVIGEETVQMQADLNHLTIDRMISFYQSLGVDLLFVEGYKQYPLPKIVLSKDSTELDELLKLTNVQAYLCTNPLREIKDSFGFDDKSTLFEYCQHNLANFTVKELPKWIR
ncbi:molybdopterin-guanine dinucleotide biosynthesis protein B [Gracilibacillus dipsosauri]|uniref:Molybdopterin-guanine dinucleotide biosynthesis protein B n=1 Tax=Gracilibacillus dipsosauri TaxID=178340 RepID=A0A317KXC4_9BACI|nr:molybdopterin-guanine dinucleotide biosynthesis protein B [Gracilibacillus dipsosauri]PWU68147.1 molybdopterin-guanine dinucleotide biosynthesis protein B [Gracilibacillus dipsosauri]